MKRTGVSGVKLSTVPMKVWLKPNDCEILRAALTAKPPAPREPVTRKKRRVNEDDDIPPTVIIKSKEKDEKTRVVVLEPRMAEFTVSEKCRLCTKSPGLYSIFDDLQPGVKISSAIMTCLPIITITRGDHLPEKICLQCLGTIRSYYDFRSMCAQNQRIQNGPINVKEPPKQKETIILEVVDSDEEPPLSRLHDCECQLIQGESHNIKLFLIDNYLFDLNLQKDNLLSLKCVHLNCRATATTQPDEPDKAFVESHHNHHQLSQMDVKKQVFIHTLRARMQSTNKSLKQVYKEASHELQRLVSLKVAVDEIVCSQSSIVSTSGDSLKSFEEFWDCIETMGHKNVLFTKSNEQFYQEKLKAEDGSRAVVFGVRDSVLADEVGFLYVDCSFDKGTNDPFEYHLLSVLAWINDSYSPLLFALVDQRTQPIFKLIFEFLRDSFAPLLHPPEIITGYHAPLYYALSEVYICPIGGSYFHYVEQTYKKVCALSLAQELERSSTVRTIYHMILMLPLLPASTIPEGLEYIKQHAQSQDVAQPLGPLFDYISGDWLEGVTPEMFCVHRVDNRICESIAGVFRKLRDLILCATGTKRKSRDKLKIYALVHALMDLQAFLYDAHKDESKRKAFARDLITSQKKNVCRAWNHIDNYPTINIFQFFKKVLSFIKCSENQLWVWGLYGYSGTADEELISADRFTLIDNEGTLLDNGSGDHEHNYHYSEQEGDNSSVDAVEDF